MEEYINEKEILQLKISNSVKVNVKCFYCKNIISRIVFNAKNNMKKYGHIICPACMIRMRMNNMSKSDFEKRKRKSEETKIAKYGSLENAYRERNKKSEKTCLERYGVRFSTQSEIMKEKSKKTCQERYGVDNGGGSQKALDKMKKHFMEKYGVDNPWKSKEIIEKIKQTHLERYGVVAYTQTEEYQRKAKKRYTYNNVTFDSSWELAFFIFHKDLGHNINRYTKGIIYKDKKGGIHKYFPDFEIDEKLYEIKGTQFYSGKTFDGGIFKSDIYKSKYQCMIENNVNIITDIKPYLKYINEKYGKGYLQNFRNK